MIFTKEINYRPFYNQTDLYFQFDILKYNSQNFEIGLSGNGPLFFSFVSGFIKSPDSKIIGSFKEEPISIDGYISTQGNGSKLNYSLNGIPKDRDIGLYPANLSKFVIKINDVWPELNQKFVEKYVDLEVDILGKNVPSFEFRNVKITNTDGLIGEISLKNASHDVEIFNITSPNVAGDWTFFKIMSPNTFYPFSNPELTNSLAGIQIGIDLDTSAGIQSYNLGLITEGGTVTPEPEPEQEIAQKQYISVFRSSNPISNTAVSEAFYEVTYAIGRDHSIDLKFDYNAGKVGNLSYSGDFNLPITYSGILPVKTNGTCDGTLYNSDFKYNYLYQATANQSIFPYQRQVELYPEEELSKTLSNLTPNGGSVTIAEPLEGFYSQISDSQIYNTNFSGVLDLGGLKGKPSNSTTSYKYYTTDYTNLFANITIDIPASQGAEATVEKFTFQTGRISLQTEKNQSDTITASPYRGLAVNYLDKLEIASAVGTDNYVYWNIIDKDNPAFIYKNVHNNTVSKDVDLSSIKGFILSSDNTINFTDLLLYEYKDGTRGQQTISRAIGGSNIANGLETNLIDLIHNDYTAFYNSLEQFSTLDDPIEQEPLTTFIYDRGGAAQKSFNFSATNPSFLINRFFNLNNQRFKNAIYKSINPHIAYSFDDPIFFYSNGVNNVAAIEQDKNFLPKLFQDTNQSDVTLAKTFIKEQGCILTKQGNFLKITNAQDGFIQIPFKTQTEEQNFKLVFYINKTASNQYLQLFLSNNAFHSLNHPYDIRSYINFNLNTGEGTIVNDKSYDISVTLDAPIPVGTEVDVSRYTIKIGFPCPFGVGDDVFIDNIAHTPFQTGTLYKIKEKRLGRDNTVYLSLDSVTHKESVTESFYGEKNGKIKMAEGAFTSVKKTDERVDSQNYFNIEVSFKCRSPEKYHHLIFNFIESQNSTRFPQSSFIEPKEIILRSIYLSPNPTSSPLITQTQSGVNLTFKVIFDYIIYKLHGISGVFSLVGQTLSFIPATDISTLIEKQSVFMHPEIIYVIYRMIGGRKISSEAPFTNPIAQGITDREKQDLSFDERVFSKTLTHLNIQNDTIDPFFSIGTDFVNLYANGEEFSVTDYGDGVKKIISIIQNNNPQYSCRFSIIPNENSLFSSPTTNDFNRVRIPRQASSQEISVASYRETTLQFEIKRQGKIRLNILNGYAGYWDDKDFFYRSTDPVGAIRSFPEEKERFGAEPTITILDATLKRLLYFKSDSDTLPLSKDFNPPKPIILTEGYCESIVNTDVTLTGLLPNVEKRTPRVWEAKLSDNALMQNAQDIIVENSNNINQSIYFKNNFTVGKNDNEEHQAYLKIKYLNPPEQMLESPDKASISLIIKSGINNTIVGETRIPIAR